LSGPSASPTVFRTTVKRGYKLAKPPGGRVGHPVAKVRNSRRSVSSNSVSTSRNCWYLLVGMSVMADVKVKVGVGAKVRGRAWVIWGVLIVLPSSCQDESTKERLREKGWVGEMGGRERESRTPHCGSCSHALARYTSAASRGPTRSSPPHTTAVATPQARTRPTSRLGTPAVG
jgi:hypothetical protein